MNYERTTDGIRVRVHPSFSLPESDPLAGEFVFSYRVEVENTGSEDAQLLFRYWFIHDASGHDTEVDGEGVIGEQPRITVGASHTYTSFCMLRSPAGYMEGYYTFERPDGSRFRVTIPRFDLVAPIVPPGSVIDPSGEERLH
ncbi:MAG: Co2+/Mg2+ efflux protein ApaG [Longimicrobiales bacterium]|nr:Co2+/Mg2+ efflux protein ApaG [Longimicrobiales bacterium]